MGRITEQPQAVLPLDLAATIATIVQDGENRQAPVSALAPPRQPSPHAASHAAGGSDEVTPVSIDAADRVHGHVVAEITDAGTAAAYDVGTAVGELPALIDVDTFGLAGLPAVDGSLLTGLGPGSTNLGVPQGEITATTLVVSSDTGSDALVPAATTTTAGLMTSADWNKLAGVEDGATANSPDGVLLARSNHTGTQDSQSITIASGQRLLGRWSAGSGVSELIQIGANLTLSSGVLSATAATVDSIDDLGDVTISSPQDGQVLVWNSTTMQWENDVAPGGGGGTVTRVDGGFGLTGSVTTSGSLNVGAGEGITVGSDDVRINRTATDTWYAPLAHNQNWSTITNTPTTLVGYGITDAATAAQGALADSALQPADNISELTNDADYMTQAAADARYILQDISTLPALP